MKRLLFILIGVMQAVLVMAQIPGGSKTPRPKSPISNPIKVNHHNQALRSTEKPWVIIAEEDNYLPQGRVPFPPTAKDPVQRQDHFAK